MEIYKVIEHLKIAEYDLHKAKEFYRNKEDQLYLHADWTALKEEGITNQRQRDAHVREITKTQREKVFKLEIERDHLKRLYHAMLREQPGIDITIDEKPETKMEVE